MLGNLLEVDSNAGEPLNVVLVSCAPSANSGINAINLILEVIQSPAEVVSSQIGHVNIFNVNTRLSDHANKVHQKFPFYNITFFDLTNYHISSGNNDNLSLEAIIEKLPSDLKIPSFSIHQIVLIADVDMVCMREPSCFPLSKAKYKLDSRVATVAKSVSGLNSVNACAIIASLSNQQIDSAAYGSVHSAINSNGFWESSITSSFVDDSKRSIIGLLSTWGSGLERHLTPTV